MLIGALVFIVAAGVALVALAAGRQRTFKKALIFAISGLAVLAFGKVMLRQPTSAAASIAEVKRSTPRTATAPATPAPATPAPTDSPILTPSPEPTASTIMQGLDLGDTATVGSKPIPCFNSTDDIGSYVNADAAGDKVGEDQALSNAVIASPGDHLLMVDNSMSPFATGAVRIRLTSGANADQACWLEGDLLMSNLTHHQAKR